MTRCCLLADSSAFGAKWWPRASTISSMSLLASLLFAGALQAPSWEADLNAALAKVELTQSTARFDETILRLFRKGEFAPPIYLAMSEDPWRVPAYTSVKRGELVKAAGRPSDLLAAGGQWLGWGVRRTLLGNPNAELEKAALEPGSLAKQLDQMVKEGLLTKKPLPSQKQVPQAVQQAACLVLSSAQAVHPMVKAATGKIGDPARAHKILAGSGEPEGLGFVPTLDLYRAYDPSPMASAGHDFFLACQTAAEWAAKASEEATYSFTCDTAFGPVILRGGADDQTLMADPFLVIDTGGNDTTINAARAASPARPLSVHIDTAGNDRFLSDPALATVPVEAWEGRRGGSGSGPASAQLGISVLIDCAGDDLYRSHRPAFGSARMGCAMLLDKGGSDTYDSYNDSLGFGLFGGGILEDLEGDDTYSGFTQVQGTGITMGLGLLVDRGGSDLYSANDKVIDNPSPQSAQHNVSMSQGAGYGRRADYTDGHSLAGGVGILLDIQGDDRYSCGVFGQGVGYWMGVGLLWDLAGQDSYSGQWYCQGASAHFAVGILEEESGNDGYLSPMNMAQGAGHDFSVGLLKDGSGDDKYVAPNLSLGGGNANGIGWLLELGGSDSYTSSGITLGRASENPSESLRSKTINLGVFMDLGGQDSYPVGSAWAQNGSLIGQIITKGSTPRESALGVFLDR